METLPYRHLENRDGVAVPELEDMMTLTQVDVLDITISYDVLLVHYYRGSYGFDVAYIGA